MNIKEASQRTGMSADTIRYYERIGLIHPIKRNKSGIRDFDEEDLKWIHFAQQMRGAGLSVEALKEYLVLFREGDRTIPVRKELLRRQIKELEAKITLFRDAMERLEYKLDHYEEHLNPFEKTLKK